MPAMFGKMPDKHDLKSYIEYEEVENIPLRKVRRMLTRRIEAGTYDFEKSVKAFEPIVREAAAEFYENRGKYKTDLGVPNTPSYWTRYFSPERQRAVAVELAKTFKNESDRGEWDYLRQTQRAYDTRKIMNRPLFGVRS